MLFINVRKYNSALLDACSTSHLGLKVRDFRCIYYVISRVYISVKERTSLLLIASALTALRPNSTLILLILMSSTDVHRRLRPSQHQVYARGLHLLSLPESCFLCHRLHSSVSNILTILQVLRWMKAHAADPKHYIAMAPQ
jgi:hypothetical protein